MLRSVGAKSPAPLPVRGGFPAPAAGECLLLPGCWAPFVFYRVLTRLQELAFAGFLEEFVDMIRTRSGCECNRLFGSLCSGLLVRVSVKILGGQALLLHSLLVKGSLSGGVFTYSV